MTALEKNTSPSSSPDLTARFCELSIRFAHFAEEAGVCVTPFRNSELPLFSAQKIEKKADIVRALAVSVEICQAMKNNGQSFGSSPALVWQALKTLGLRPPSDLFSRITEESVVEIHSAQGVQLFRNFNFYKFCSYSIEELSCGSWEELFIRDPRDLQALMYMAIRTLSMTTSATLPVDVPVHRVFEASSPLKNELELKMLFGAPLFNESSSHPVATIVIESVSLIASHGLLGRPLTSPFQLITTPL